MIGLELRFLAGRFHGNGWYHAHNEGIPEWPPSPWRVLRALVSAAYAGDVAPAKAEPLFEKLRALPRYRLPRAVDAHTRHYMPDIDDAGHKRAKVFDAFVAIEGGARDPRPVTMAWAVELTSSERSLLESLCARTTYLGRAESWADLRVVDVGGDDWDCWPHEQLDRAGATNLLAVATAEELEALCAERPKPKKGPDIPRRLWDVLTFDGARYRSEGWSRVPGTRLVRYVFERAPFDRAVTPAVARRPRTRPNVARFAIRSAVLPRLEHALAVTERLRTSAMSRSRDLTGDARPVFSGHGHEPSNHGHAMFLACSDDPANAARGVIDHLLIAARDGFDDHDVLALQQIRRLWGRGGHDLELVLVGLGSAADLGGREPPRTAVLATGRVWESVTPFVPTRHPKRVRGQWRESIEQQIRRACIQFVGLEPSEVTEIGERDRWARFHRRRHSGGGRRGPDRGYGVRLVFDTPQQGPIALGYGAHFGLGLFRAVADADIATGEKPTHGPAGRVHDI